MPTLSIVQLNELVALLAAKLPERMEALERRLAAGPPQPEPLAKRNASRQADGARLRQAIADILARHAGRPPMSAKRVLRSLEQAGISPLPSDRTVRWHMRALRGNGNAAVLPT